MLRMLRFVVMLLASASLALGGATAIAQPKDKDKDRKEQSAKPDKPDKDQDKEKKPKKAKHQDGKKLVGDKVRKDGKHKFHDHGKHSAFVDVKGGKIAGINVKHAEKGDVKVTKYKTTRKMAEASGGAMQPVSLLLTQAGTTYMGTAWIGYAYIDEWGDEVIYWFPYDMIYDGDTGAIEYVPAY